MLHFRDNSVRFGVFYTVPEFLKKGAKARFFQISKILKISKMPKGKYLIADQARVRFVTCRFDALGNELHFSWTKNPEMAYSFNTAPDAIEFEDGAARDFLEETGELTTIVYSDTLESIY